MPKLRSQISKIDYPAHLEVMWQKAIAPRTDGAPTFISTFAGGGGSSTGYLMAGYRELLAVEWDDNAVETLRLNYPHLDIYHGDIAKLSVDETLERTGLQVGELDLFDGSPPCQGFSTAGKRQLNDPRNQLFREYTRLLRGLQPKVFVMENVSGMVKGKMKLLFAEILQELKASGYKVSARLLNAMYFHVPQSRQRLIFIGVRDDLGIEPSHPSAESQPITPILAFDNLPVVQYELDEASLKGRGLEAYWHQTTQGSGNKVRFGLKKIAPNKVSNTITKTGGKGQAALCHWESPRYATRSELRRIGSFPDSYYFRGDLSKHFERIGNSVPPLMAEAVGRHIRNEILDKI